jgi:hypothetical protein
MITQESCIRYCSVHSVLHNVDLYLYHYFWVQDLVCLSPVPQVCFMGMCICDPGYLEHILWVDKPAFLYRGLSATGGSGTVSMVHARQSTNLWGGNNIWISIWLTTAWLDMATVQLPQWPYGMLFLLSVLLLLAVCHSVVQQNGVLAHFCAQPQLMFSTQFSSE